MQRFYLNSLKKVVDKAILLCYNIFEVVLLSYLICDAVKGIHKVLDRNEKNSFMEKQGRNETQQENKKTFLHFKNVLTFILKNVIMN